MTTKAKQNFEWTTNLWEVGSPILSEAREIAWLIEQAAERLAVAKLAHAESLAIVQAKTATLEHKIASLWTPEEIAEAKAGRTLVL